MKTTLRGLAVLAVLVLAPCARAVTVTSTFTNSPLLGNVAGANIFLPAYDQSAPLTGAMYFIELSVRGYLSEFNPFDTPKPFGQGVNITSSAVLLDEPGGNVLGIAPSTFLIYSQGVVVLSPGGSSAMSFDVRQSMFLNINDQNSLSILSATQTPNVYVWTHIAHGSNFGGMNFAATATVTALYNVPSEEQSFTLLGIALLGVAAVHRIIKKGALLGRAH